MTLVDRQNSIGFLFPSKLSPSRRVHRSPSSTSLESSRSSSPSTYSFTHMSQESSQVSEASCSTASTTACPIPFLGPSKTRTSCLSEYWDSDAYRCNLGRRTHMRRKPKPRVIRPLPQIPTPPARPLPCPTGLRKLPLLPPRPQHPQHPQRSSLSNYPASVETDSLHCREKPPSLVWDPYFTPEIDWDAIMVEIVRGNSRENNDYYDYSDDAESIYTEEVYVSCPSSSNSGSSCCSCCIILSTWQTLRNLTVDTRGEGAKV
ncbi:hypothetical protein J3R30DRAFT_3523810 [Lentinula aciculospora]|uniref:Uncharacterized protein n=1 Tax=Lentinula aciculospora TaxID=153920 RepID=A0A9W9DJD0_9AGAR|nr:hypothetical protein J3R30DRAFT_3523810 [Lentinula aciculospora]